VISFFPYVIPAIVIGLIWSQIYDPSAGLLNGILTRLGLEQFTSFAWLGDPRTARWAVMFVIIWGLVGFYMVLFIAAIKGVPAEVFEAARTFPHRSFDHHSADPRECANRLHLHWDPRA
jgi:N-acetylglucosamine transport system permease protein